MRDNNYIHQEPNSDNKSQYILQSEDEYINTVKINNMETRLSMSQLENSSTLNTKKEWQEIKDNEFRTFDLTEVINKYGSYPELLQLILSSKVEEDRRKTEEAKLRQKELDYYLLSKDLTPQNYYWNSSITSCLSTLKHEEPQKQMKRKRGEEEVQLYREESSIFAAASSHLSSSIQQISLSDETQNGTNQILTSLSAELNHNKTISSPTAILELQSLNNSITSNSNDNNKPIPEDILPPIGITTQAYSPSNDEKAETVSNNKSVRSYSTLDSFEASIMETLPINNRLNTLNYSSSECVGKSFNNKSVLLAQKHDVDISLKMTDKNLYEDENKSLLNTMSRKVPIPPNNRSNNKQHISLNSSPIRQSRRRKEMQAITMIIETKEFPYDDKHAWKNNGNTVHKKTAQRNSTNLCLYLSR
ncbi:uncharacterized protein BX663DRAFT_484847 [Cokeromyces recurvatus]|uniref:uncharacterized protein n=1 Tax=Cokeromyces recurvatus TaxID=90255 RepID=UPI00221EC909|nr:uncharacterized protein BX663DRAFT_484847 [Cokeromyces recurvatus]KAI7904753.1 hypothetical protein BX663DRAFT_484847 [Cokeromyces recurvatus]